MFTYIGELVALKNIKSVQRLYIQTDKGCAHISPMECLEGLVLVYNGGCTQWYIPPNVTMPLAHMKRLEKLSVFDSLVDEKVMLKVNPRQVIKNYFPSFDMTSNKYEGYESLKYNSVF